MIQNANKPRILSTTRFTLYSQGISTNKHKRCSSHQQIPIKPRQELVNSWISRIILELKLYGKKSWSMASDRSNLLLSGFTMKFLCHAFCEQSLWKSMKECMQHWYITQPWDLSFFRKAPSTFLATKSDSYFFSFLHEKDAEYCTNVYKQSFRRKIVIWIRSYIFF